MEIIIAFATWRMTSLIANEQGPYDIFEKFRNRFKISCFWCVSVWVAMFFSLGQDNWFFSVLAYSAVAIIIDELIELIQRK